jgi:DNA-binding MarR family transcriptional regulator
MGAARRSVKVQNTHNIDRLGGALVGLIGFLNSPQRDEALLREADVDLDRALFPLLVSLGVRGSLAVAEIGELVGRDHTTVSRQLAKLESLKLIAREASAADRRRNAATLTKSGRKIVDAITAARRRLLAKALVDWSAADCKTLAQMIERFSEALGKLAQQ